MIQTGSDKIACDILKLLGVPVERVHSADISMRAHEPINVTISMWADSPDESDAELQMIERRYKVTAEEIIEDEPA